MKIKKLSIVLYFITAMIASCIPQSGYAEGETSFLLSQSTDLAFPDQAIEVTLKGNNLKELYAYEALITFDPEMVELDFAESRLEGFFIPPKADNGKIKIAYTKIGKKAGEQGSIALSTITFKGIAQGNAHIKLNSVKALDTKLTAAVYRYGTGTTFHDLEGYDWAKLEIEALAALEVINGTSVSTFSPEDDITRADFICLLVRALQLQADVVDNFEDVEQSDYYYKEIGIAKGLGIAQGTGDNHFDPKTSISRQDMMVIAARAMKISGRMLEEPASNLSRFNDSSEVAAYAVSPLARLAKEGIIQGSNNMIMPHDTAIRAEAAVIIYRLLNY
jgi:hypothetical protein